MRQTILSTLRRSSRLNDMAKSSADQITKLLLAWGQGENQALDDLMPIVYDELRRLAHHYMRGQPNRHTLQTTALVNEAYIRLIDTSRVNWQDRAHFFAISAQMMRRVLVDFARSKGSLKRGGDVIQITLDEQHASGSNKNELDLVALDEALVDLAKLNNRQSRVVELRYFGGLSEEQVAEVLEISVRTVRRDWRVARAWLFRELKDQ
jgi:RNA polymerase sigma factor (TIGR02999 family)